MCLAMQCMRFPFSSSLLPDFTWHRLSPRLVALIVDMAWDSFPVIFGQPACAFLTRSLHEGPDLYKARVVSLTTSVRKWEADLAVVTECLEDSQAMLRIGGGFVNRFMSPMSWIQDPVNIQEELRPSCGQWPDDPQLWLCHCRADEKIVAPLRFFQSCVRRSFHTAVDHPFSQIERYDGLMPHDGKLCHCALNSIEFQHMGVTVKGDETAAQLAVMCQVFRRFSDFAHGDRYRISPSLPIDLSDQPFFVGMSCADPSTCRGQAFDQGALTTRAEYEEKQLARLEEERQRRYSFMQPQMLEMSRDQPSGLVQPFDPRELLGTPRTMYQSGTSQTYPSVCDGMDLADENPPFAFLRDLDRLEAREKEQRMKKQLLESETLHDGFSCMEGFYPGICGIMSTRLDLPYPVPLPAPLPAPLPPPAVDDWAPMGNPAGEGWGDAAADDGWGGAAAGGAAADDGWGGARRVRPRLGPWDGWPDDGPDDGPDDLHRQDGPRVLPRGPFWPAPRYPRFSLMALPTETRLAAYEIVRWAVARWGRGSAAAEWSREQMRAQLSVTRKQAEGLLKFAFATDVFVPDHHD